MKLAAATALLALAVLSLPTQAAAASPAAAQRALPGGVSFMPDLQTAGAKKKAAAKKHSKARKARGAAGRK